MNAVGIAAFAGKGMVAGRRPFNEVVAKPFEVRHTNSSSNWQTTWKPGQRDAGGDSITRDRPVPIWWGNLRQRSES